ncbi:MAG: TetR/AcrR family transcriptional regulator C-terminal ligand-binding domain-containing protein [Hyphomonadaceae bacterium]|nr:TetR/AcrR family transcriptional regulator C-terminal ligand-binding domain-containing protein [Hyphomonadaceae bacterium]MBP9233215.1 TetR/AcrR family transcriptional regulator C-terminal ligand-binding domain-containing protein [Hyphomonadaceae bacterium]
MSDDDIPLTSAEEVDKRRVGPRRSEASTNAVLVAAYTELSEHGWRGFSVDRVAKTAKASKQTIYRWWKSAACLAVDAALATLAERPAPVAANADVRDRIAALIEPMLVAVRTGDGAHAWRGALLAAADDSDAGEIFRAWFSESVKVPLRHILAEQALKGVVRRDWDIDLATELLFGPIWHRLIAMRGPVPEAYSRRLVESVLKALAPT